MKTLDLRQVVHGRVNVLGLRLWWFYHFLNKLVTNWEILPQLLGKRIYHGVFGGYLVSFEVCELPNVIVWLKQLKVNLLHWGVNRFTSIFAPHYVLIDDPMLYFKIWNEFIYFCIGCALAAIDASNHIKLKVLLTGVRFHALKYQFTMILNVWTNQAVSLFKVIKEVQSLVISSKISLSFTLSRRNIMPIKEINQVINFKNGIP